MRIMFVADQYEYSNYALDTVITLAKNTFSDVTILGILPKDMSSSIKRGKPCDLVLDHPLIGALENYREKFLTYWKSSESPYSPTKCQYEWFALGDDLCEQMMVCRGSIKDLKVRLRFGEPVSEVLSAIEKEGVSLVVLGCTKGRECLWKDNPPFPQKLVQSVPCSVLLVKEAEEIKQIYACLDESHITQDSLEMVNQMAVLHNAKVSLVALTKGGGIKAEIYPWFDEILNYFRKKGLNVDSQFTEIEEFEQFIKDRVQHGLLAMWMGKRSLLERLFQRESIEHFISSCKASVLVLR